MNNDLLKKVTKTDEIGDIEYINFLLNQEKKNKYYNSNINKKSKTYICVLYYTSYSHYYFPASYINIHISAINDEIEDDYELNIKKELIRFDESDFENENGLAEFNIWINKNYMYSDEKPTKKMLLKLFKLRNYE